MDLRTLDEIKKNQLLEDVVKSKKITLTEKKNLIRELSNKNNKRIWKSKDIIKLICHSICIH